MEREAKLKAPDGWLSLAGLIWLRPGDNKVLDGVMTLAGDQVTFRQAGSSKANPLKPDSEDFVAVRGVKLFIIKRAGQYGVRIKDNNSEYRRNFTRLDWYPVDPSWRLNARFRPFAFPKKMLFDATAGGRQEMMAPGTVEFFRAGKALRLTPVLDNGELFFIFRDQTAGKTTYAAARFLYAKLPSKNNRVELDFNRAYNPPCVFTPYATCPLPPPDNRLSIAIEAGEKMYAGH